MQKDERDLLDVLKSELEFLERHGYRRSPETAWRPKFIFEDSHSCVNYGSEANRTPCTNCALIYLVPPAQRFAKSPCRHIPLNQCGETLDSLYRYSTQSEIESVVGSWLRTAITRLEEERMAVKSAHNPSQVKGTPLYTKQHPKCANPACSTAFHWTVGGKFLRFRPDTVPTNGNNPTADSLGGIHGVKHYWLCERCSHVLTLVYDEERGVTLKLIWPQLAAGETHKELSTA
jgi:hypothetical protein